MDDIKFVAMMLTVPIIACAGLGYFIGILSVKIDVLLERARESKSKKTPDIKP